MNRVYRWGKSILFGLVLSGLFYTQAQAQAVVNMAGGTKSAGAIVACDDGGVITAALPPDQIRPVAFNEHPGLQQEIVKLGGLQHLYSRLIPVTGKQAMRQHGRVYRMNAEALKRISMVYVQLQKERFPGLKIDVLPVQVRGERGAARRSQPFAEFIASELKKNGVQDVRVVTYGNEGGANPAPTTQRNSPVRS